MKNTFASFVIISNSIDAGKDCIDAFIPFTIHLFDIKGYIEVNVETICVDFLEEFGINIPRHPMETIINRMKPKYLVKEHGRIIVNRGEINNSAKLFNFDGEIQKFKRLIDNFIRFCEEFTTPIIVKREEADVLFTNFLKDHDLDIIFATYVNKDDSLLFNIPEINDPDKIYLLNRYVNSILEDGGEYAEYLIDSAVGHKYASLILYREFSNIRGKGYCANYYLDTGILFDIFGINKLFRKRAAEELLSLLTKKGASLWVFSHTYEEFLQIIESCLNWVESINYNPLKASRTLQHFKEENFGIAKIQLFISQIDTILEKNNIKVSNTPDPNINQIYQISMDDLRETILGVYNNGGFYFDIDDKEHTLEKDERSIESIYKLRKGNIPKNLNEATHVMMTTNSGLAYASSKFDREKYNRGYFTIPPILTDTFVGTVIWAEEPSAQVKNFNKSKIIAYTNAMLQPRANFMNRFAHEVYKAQTNELNPISAESASILLTTGLPRSLLADKTLGDINRINAQTPYEMLKELEFVLVRREQQNTDAARTEAESLRQQLNIESNEKANTDGILNEQTQNINSFVKKTAFWGKFISIAILFIISAVLFALATFQEPKSLLGKILEYLLSLFSFCTGVTLLIIGQKIEVLVKQYLNKRLLVIRKNE